MDEYLDEDNYYYAIDTEAGIDEDDCRCDECLYGDTTPEEWEDDTMDCGCACGSCYCDDESDMDPVEADADVLRMAGWGTDEDYGYFGDEY